jgi:hypothetical protein
VRKRRAFFARSLSRGGGIGVTIFLAGCAILPRGDIAQPARDWQARSGQLLYRTAKRTVVGEVLVRFSKKDDFELTFSKSPVTLLTIRQNGSFAEVRGALARMGWSGPVDRAPKQLRGWLGLRDKIISSPNQQSIRYVNGTETFLLRL